MQKPALTPDRDFAGSQCIGKRAEQEDSYAFCEILDADGAPGGVLMIVADGMGGHSAGHEASDLAVRTFVEAFQRKRTRISNRLLSSLNAANEAISAAAKASPAELEGMGTTLLAVAATPEGISWISVGDSPLYLLRGGELHRINEDHSFRPILHEMVERGEISAEQAAHSVLRHRLRSAVTGDEIALTNVSPKPFPLLDGDLVLAGSDGLQSLNDDAIGHCLSEARGADALEIANQLLQAVLNMGRPKQDNATAAIFKPPVDWLHRSLPHKSRSHARSK